MRHSAVLECRADSDRPALVRQEIEYSDFQLDELTLFVEGVAGDRCLLLTSEH